MWKNLGRAISVTLVASATIGACSSDDTSSAGSPSPDAGTSDATMPGTDSGGTTTPDGSVNHQDSGTPTGDSGNPTMDSGTPARDSGNTSGSLRFAVFGDSRDNYTAHQSVLNAMAQKNPELVLDTGDLWAGYPSGSSQWGTITKSNASIAALLTANRYLVSRGNHETVGELLAFSPTLVRNNSETYAYTIGNAYFVSLGMDPAAATAFLTQSLSSAEASAATWRFVYSHYPIYDSGDGHGPIEGVSTVESICDQYHVTAFFTGHEHIYERFNQIKGGHVVDTSDSLTASAGTVYLVSGGGGAPFYSVTTALPEDHFYKTDVNHYLLVDLTTTTMTVQALDTSNAVIDHFQIHQ
jgi:hypothetical protein